MMKRLDRDRSSLLLIEVVDPVCFQEVDQENNTAERPGNGVCPGNNRQFVNKPHGHGDIAHTNHTPDDQHGKHGNDRLARTPEHTGDAMGKGQQAVKQANGTHMLCAKINRLLGFAEKADQLRRKNIAKSANYLCHQAAANNSEGNALLCSVVLFCSQILPHKSG